MDEHWQQLNDTMRILRDDDTPFPQQTELISDFDKAFASIQEEIEEWVKKQLFETGTCRKKCKCL